MEIDANVCKNRFVLLSWIERKQSKAELWENFETEKDEMHVEL
jgi:hypothetical protein